MSSGLRGQRVVVGLYLLIVAFTGVAGYMTARVVGEIDPPRFLFLIEFPATPLGLAAFGALTIGLVLGILLFAVTVVSERVDDAAPGSEDPAAEAGDDSQPSSANASTPTDTAATSADEPTTPSTDSADEN